MKTVYVIFAFIFLFGSCSSWKDALVAEGDQNTAMKNAVQIFLHSNQKGYKKDSVFFLYAEDINKEITGVALSRTYDKVVVITKNCVEYSYRAFPTGYIEQQNKLFYWYDSTKVALVTDKLMATLSKYQLLDTLVLGSYRPEHTIEHGKKGRYYYFCKNNLRRYKKIRTQRARGHYTLPKLHCKCDP